MSSVWTLGTLFKGVPNKPPDSLEYVTREQLSGTCHRLRKALQQPGDPLRWWMGWWMVRGMEVENEVTRKKGTN
jgi:hypothetical protein